MRYVRRMRVLSLSRPVLRGVVLGVLEMECEIGLTGRNHPDVAGALYNVANNLAPFYS